MNIGTEKNNSRHEGTMQKWTLIFLVDIFMLCIFSLVSTNTHQWRLSWSLHLSLLCGICRFYRLSFWSLFRWQQDLNRDRCSLIVLNHKDQASLALQWMEVILAERVIFNGASAAVVGTASGNGHDLKTRSMLSILWENKMVILRLADFLSNELHSLCIWVFSMFLLEQTCVYITHTHTHIYIYIIVYIYIYIYIYIGLVDFFV